MADRSEERSKAVEAIGNFGLSSGSDDREKREMLKNLSASLERASQRRVGDFTATANAFKAAGERRQAEEAMALGGREAGEAAARAQAQASQNAGMEAQYRADHARRTGQAAGEGAANAAAGAEVQGANAFAQDRDNAEVARELAGRKGKLDEADIARELEQVQATAARRNQQLAGAAPAPMPNVVQPGVGVSPSMAQLQTMEQQATPDMAMAPMPNVVQPGPQGPPNPEMDLAYRRYLAQIGAMPAAPMPQLQQPAQPMPQPFPGYGAGLEAYFGRQ